MKGGMAMAAVTTVAATAVVTTVVLAHSWFAVASKNCWPSHISFVNWLLRIYISGQHLKILFNPKGYLVLKKIFSLFSRKIGISSVIRGVHL